MANTASNTFGKVFTITSFGESHGAAVGVVIDGCPPGVNIDLNFIQAELDRRRPGQSRLVTPRKETDRAEILSGVFEGKSIGAPIALLIRNKNQRSSDYSAMRDKYRPSHADFSYDQKYGIRDWRGGGRASARETIARVAGGAVASLFLRELFPKFTSVEVLAFTRRIAAIESDIATSKIKKETIEGFITRAPDAESSAKMAAAIKSAKSAGDSLGGVIECVVRGVPSGLGMPVFDKLEADLAKAMLSIPASKGFEIGSGFAGTYKKGSEHNDIFVKKNGKIGTATNNSGGVQGGISNGEDIVFRVAFKPTATILQKQKTVNVEGEDIELAARGRHDPCVLPRAVPIVEAMTWLVFADHVLRQRAMIG